MENSIMSYEDLLKEKVANVPIEHLVNTLFSVAEELICTGTTLSETFQEMIKIYYVKTISMSIRTGDFEILYKNILYQTGFFLKHSQSIKYTDFIKAVSTHSVEVLKDANKYFYEVLDDAYMRINECKRIIPDKDISYKYYKGFLNSLEKTIENCRKDIFVELYDLTFCEEFMNAKPVLVLSLSGDLNKIFNCIQAVKNELLVLQSFSAEEKTLVYNAYSLRTKEENLYDKVLSQYLLANFFSNEGSLYIDKIDAQLLIRQMKNMEISECDFLRIIDNLKVNDTDALSYLKQYISILTRRINIFKKTAFFSELFTIIEKTPSEKS